MSSQRAPGDRVSSKISKELREKGAAVYSTCSGFAYARNGNAHNPTPRLLWVATIHGEVVSRAVSRKSVLEALRIALGMAKEAA